MGLIFMNIKSHMIMPHMWQVYCDGACQGNPGPGGWGVCLYDPWTDQVVELGGSSKKTTNNQMELQAVISALQYVQEKSKNFELKPKILIQTDSLYVIQGTTIWSKSWIKNGWRTAQKKPVLNQIFWVELLSLASYVEITWKHVPGHKGILGNEKVDEIAREFASGHLNEKDLYLGPREKYFLSDKIFS